ncbi:MAG: MotA/TolQ/ExbB proton channel family protein [Bryobacteraceae bacterium]
MRPFFDGPLLDVNIWELVSTSQPIPLAVLVILLVFSLLSWAIVFSKWSAFRSARESNRKFLRAFRKAADLNAVAAASEQFQTAPLVTVFDFGFSEVSRQFSARGALTSKIAVERSLQLGMSEEIAKLERNMNWLATVATTTPFIGLLGTVFGIIDAFQALGLEGSTSMRTVAPGIAHALVATAMGLIAAIPAAIAYNYFGQSIKEFGARMEDFGLEFINLVERVYER